MAERGLAAPRTEHAPPCLWSNLDYRHHRYQEQLPNSDFEQAPSSKLSETIVYWELNWRWGVTEETYV